MRSPAPAKHAAVAIAYAIVCVVWGSTYLFIKLGVEVMPPYLLGGLRFSIAGVILLAACALTGRRLPRGRALAGTVLVGLLLLAVGNGFLNISETMIDSGLAALLVAATPLWMTLLAMLGKGGERLAPLGWVGLAVAFAGVAILVRPDAAGSWMGVGAVLVASLAWAVGSVYARRRLRGVDPFAASAVETAAAGPTMLAVHLLLERNAPIEWGGQAWLAVGYLAVMGSLVGYTAFVYINTHMTSSKVGTYAYVNPVVAVLLGWWFLDEPVTWRLIVGGAVILGGLVLLYAARVREATPPPAQLRGSAPAPGGPSSEAES